MDKDVSERPTNVYTYSKHARILISAALGHAPSSTQIHSPYRPLDVVSQTADRKALLAET
jgi:hypothetical protein